eukprot:7114447-Lingulodinium_polyedra.AAC.1
MPAVVSAASWTCGSNGCRGVNWPGRARCRLCGAYCPAYVLAHPAAGARPSRSQGPGRSRGGSRR